MTESARRGEPVSPWIKVQTCLLAALLFLVAVLVVVVGLTAQRVEDSLDLVQTDLEALEIQQINEAVAALTAAADRLAAVDVDGLNETAQSLKSAADSLSKVDVQTLNGAITALKDAANTLQDLEIEALNGVIQSLNSAVASLQAVTGTISGIFGR